MNEDQMWNLAKQQIESIDIPDKEGELVPKGESHTIGKTEIHQLDSYELPLGKINGFTAQVNYSICPTCRMMWNKRIVMFRENPAIVHIKEFVRKGENV